MNNDELYKYPFDDLSIAKNIQVQIVNESDELQKNRQYTEYVYH